jgi:uncharacterized protein (TIGR03084 family)
VADLEPVLTDLQAESAELDALVAELDDAGWATPTPAAGWTIAHQIAHLSWTDQAAVLAITDPSAFGRELQRALADGSDMVDAAAERAVRELRPAELLARWRDGRAALAAALRGVPAGERIAWFGPPMVPTSMATARIMECWAHGGDVADALGVERAPTSRLRHVAHLGVRTRDFAFRMHGLEPPAEPFRVELFGPDDAVWTWGPEDALQWVTGPALDFCLLVTRRRHRDDLALAAAGRDADHWLDLAQAFAGPPGEGRPPRGPAETSKQD